MARTSAQKFIARNRAPRVTLEYSVETYGATPSRELPFVIGVLADLTGTPLQVPPSLAERRMTEIDIDNFDDRMRSLKPRTAFRVPDAIHGQGELIVELTFASMEDFLPAAIARNVPGLDQILTARTQLANLVVYMHGKTDAGLLVQRVLHDDAGACSRRCDLCALSVRTRQPERLARPTPRDGRAAGRERDTHDVASVPERPSIWRFANARIVDA